MEERNIAQYIDHTLLRANATEAQIRRLCEEAMEYHFASVCVNTCYVPLAAELLKGSGVKTCCVVGFPLGAMSTEGKAFEAADAVKKGAEEVDMVINVGAIKSGNWDYVKEDIERVVKASHDKALVKVIIETCLLTDEEKVHACITAKEAGADFVKTSTGFSTGGATVGSEMGVKASGGVRTYEDAIAMIEAGASRIGASSGIAIVAGAKSRN